MPLNSCPHYPPSGATGPTFVCAGCGAEVANVANLQAQKEGLVTGAGGPKVINLHNANTARRRDK